MDMNVLKGQWKVIKGEARRKWGKLTGDDLEAVAGDKDILIGKLQTRYGKEKADAESEVNAWLKDLDKSK